MFGRKRRKDPCNNFNDHILKHVLSLLLISFRKSLSVEPYRPLIFSLLSGIVASTPNRMIEDLERPVSVNEGLLSRTKTSAGLSGLDIFEEIYTTTNWFFSTYNTSAGLNLLVSMNPFAYGMGRTCGKSTRIIFPGTILCKLDWPALALLLI